MFYRNATGGDYMSLGNTSVTCLDIDHGVNDALVSRGHSSPKEMILGELKKRVDRIDIAGCEPGEEDAFYVADMGEVYRQHMRWKMNLGRVKPFYGEPSSSPT